MGELFVSTLLTFLGVAVAVGAFSALWVGLNLLFDQASVNFGRFSAISGALVGAILFAILDGNRLLLGLAVTRPETLFNGDEPGIFTDGLVNALLGHLSWPLIGAALGGAFAYGLSRIDNRRSRLLAGLTFGVLVGLILSMVVKSRYELALKSTPLVVSPLLFAAVGAGAARLGGGNITRGLLGGGFIGWCLGAFGGGLHGVSVASQLETSLAFAVAGGLAGAFIGRTALPDGPGRTRIEDGARSWLFVGPAVLFITVMLIVPAAQTFLLSMQVEDSPSVISGFAGFENYQTVFADEDNFRIEDAQNLFTSAEPSASGLTFPWGGSAILPWVLFFALAGVILALMLGRETGQAFALSGPPLLPLLLAVTLFAFALFTHVRGTIVNNVWWVIAVTLMSTAIGLAIARLADGMSFESLAKSLIFMPMAISMVGASIIWRLIMYRARNETKDQTGVLNAAWVWLGRNTTEWGVGKIIIGGIFAFAALILFYAAFRVLSKSASTSLLYVVLSAIPLWVAFRTFGDGIGGYRFNDSGEILPRTINFVQDSPYNSFWLMIILIWIQTGFAMVILSAAIKAVPTEYIEAASLDGADSGQVFWRITVPTIAPTIGVVATTIMVNVMKVFDIVKVTTNGQFDSQVLANAMYQESFLFANRGVGAALAVLIFIGIFPVMAFNILRLTREEA